MGPSSNSSLDPRPFENLGEIRREHDHLLERYGELLGDETSPAAEARVVDAMCREIDAFVARSLSTGVVLDAYPERTTAQTLIDYWVTMQIRCGREVPRRRLARFDEARLPELADSACPYVGLEPFKDDQYFHGRELDTRRLTELVAANRLVVVHGTSGSGKSSLVFGGLLPQLHGESGEGGWHVESFTPGDRPVERLAHAMAAVSGAAAAARRLVVVDQFEEIFTLVSEDERERFDAALRGVLEREPPVHVVITVREEFFARVAALEAATSYADFAMRPLTYPELTAAIEKPAAGVNLVFERGIVETLVTEVLGQPAALPLLQFSLRQLWNARHRNRITRAALDEVGGPSDALARAADAFYDRQIEENRKEIARVLTALVRVDELLESYRQPVNRGVLLAAGNARTAEVINELEKVDFVRVTPVDGGDAVVEIKHEALIRNWPKLDAWIVKKRGEQRNRLALLRSATAWDKARRPKEGLYRGWQLDEASEIADLSPLEKEFVEASKADTKREIDEEKARANRLARLLGEEKKYSDRRRRLLYVTAAALVVVFAAAVIAYLLQARQTRTMRRQAAQAVQDKRTAETTLAQVQREVAEGKLEAEAKVSEVMQLEFQLKQQLAELARQRAELKAVADLKSSVEAFAKLLEAAKGGFGANRLAIYAKGQVDEARALVAVVRKTGLRATYTSRVSALPENHLFYYYDADRASASRLRDIFDKGLGIEIKVKSRVGDPTFFGPDTAPVHGLLELYFVEGGVPNIDDTPHIPAPVLKPMPEGKTAPPRMPTGD
jgi:hypothetical protein